MGKYIRSFRLQDIKNYEADTGDSILDYLKELNINSLLKLIKLNRKLDSLEDAGDILDTWLKDCSIIDIFEDMQDELLGSNPDKDGDNSEDGDEDDGVQLSKFNTLTDLYIYYCMQLTSIGLSYSDFWMMNTSELFKVFNSIVIKLNNETNRELNNYYTLAALVGSAVWGKLPKEPPQVKIDKQDTSKASNFDTLTAKLNSLAAIHKNK